MVNLLLQNSNGFCLQTMSILSRNVVLAKTNTERARWTKRHEVEFIAWLNQIAKLGPIYVRHIQIHKWQIVDSLPGLLRLTEIALYHLNETQFSFNVGELL